MSEQGPTNPEDLVAPARPLWLALAPVVIVLAALAAYSNSFSGPFIFDDVHAIPNNPAIRSLRTFWVMIPPEKVGVARRPLANLSFAITYAIDGLNVRSYHVGNLLIHILAALTLYGIVRRTLLLPSFRNRFGGVATGLAAAAALIWAVHPLQTESVTYIVQRHESLMGLCYLLTLYCAIRSATSERPWPWTAAAIAVCALGMGAKEVMVTAPIVVLLYDRAFLSGSFREAFRRRGALYLGLAATWAVLGALMLHYTNPDGAVQFGLKRTTDWQHLRTQPGVILHYLALSFWPRPLCLDYSWPLAKTFWQIAPAALAVSALLGATVWALRRAPAVGFLGAWFFLILAPTSSILPLEECFEHRMYLPLAALTAAFVVAAYWAGERLAKSDQARKRFDLGMVIGALLLAAALGTTTFLRNADYRTAFSIWDDTARKRPNNARAQDSLGAAWFDLGRRDEAMRHYDRAVELNPDFADTYYNRALAYTDANDSLDALNDLDKFISLKPDSADAYFNRGGVRSKLNRLDDAIQDYGKFIELKPDAALGYFNRATVEARAKRLNDAIADYGKAVELNPDYAEAYNNRGLTYVGVKRFSDALKDYDKAIALKPDYAEAFFNRASARVGTGRYDLALPDCNRAIALKPGDAAAYNVRAIVAFRLKDYDRAWSDVAMFQKLGGRPHPGFLNALKQASGRSQ